MHGHLNVVFWVGTEISRANKNNIIKRNDISPMISLRPLKGKNDGGSSYLFTECHHAYVRIFKAY